MIDILERLSEPLVMSMFASSDDLYREQEKQRVEAAAEIAKLRAANERLREALSKIAQDDHVQRWKTKPGIIARAALEGESNG